MKKVDKVISVLTLCFIITLPLLASAVSWSPLEEQRSEKATDGIIEKGSIVCLFQSGTADVKRSIHINDILTVYREDKNHHSDVGKIRILSYVGEDYLRGEIVEGGVKAGDIAKKGDAASLIISSENTCK
jgi:hypothetical protein